MTGLTKINLGCGYYEPGFEDWLNIDARVELASEHRHFLCHDLTKPFPIPDGVIEVVYSEHVLEHFDMGIAAGICSEIHRILQPNGIFRAVVPDAILRRGSDPPEVLPCEHRHKVAWTYHSLSWLLKNAGYEVKLVKYWDENGQLHVDQERLQLPLGSIKRPESLIADGIKVENV